MLVYETPGGQVSLNEIVWFSRVLRTFEGGAFTRRLLFRGAWAWGDFYLVSPDTNTVLGPAVRDVARWYDSADWIGIHATPRTSILVQALIDRGKATIDFVLLDYNVPMKDGTEVTLKAVNWPKNLHIRYPSEDAQSIRGRLGGSLAVDSIPRGVEQEHFNSRNFFDYVVEKQELEKSFHRKKPKEQPNPAITRPPIPSV